MIYFFLADCIENMACSDNVVRAGLTPKFVDVETLCSMLNYKGEPAANKIFMSVAEDNFTRLFKPPVPDFAVAEIKVRTFIYCLCKCISLIRATKS